MRTSNANPVINKAQFLESIKFKIDESGDVLTQLVAGQYKRPIDAFIRELGTNAYEAHQLLSKENVPFLVKIPSSSDPRWIIRDYGPGLSHEDVKSLYTSIGTSTKKNSNQMGGCFGLGSKSPLAYTSTFNVKSFHNGEMRLYLVYYDENLCPHFDLLSVEDSSEESGLEISIPIRNSDINEVCESTVRLYSVFLTVPKILKGTIEVRCPATNIVESLKNFHVWPNKLSVKMGNIIYPVEKFDNIDVNANLLIVLPIGSVDVSTSRESLKYTLKTKSSISLALEAGIALYKDKYEKLLNSAENIFEASLYYYREIKPRINFINHSNLSYRGNKLLPNSIDLPLSTIYYLNGTSLRKKTGYYKNNVSLGSKFEIINLDDRKAFLQKTKHLIQNANLNEVVLLEHSDKTVELLKKFNMSFDQLKKVSELTYVKKQRVAQKNENAGYTIFRFIPNRDLVTSSWEKIEDVSTIIKEKCCFVELVNYNISYCDTSISKETLSEIAAFLGINIYGVRKAGKIPSTWYKLETILPSKSDVIKIKQSELATFKKVHENLNFLRNVDKLKNLPADLLNFKNKIYALNKHNYANIALLLKVNVELDRSLVNEYKRLVDKYGLLSSYYFGDCDELKFYFKGKE